MRAATVGSSRRRSRAGSYARVAGRLAGAAHSPGPARLAGAAHSAGPAHLALAAHSAAPGSSAHPACSSPPGSSRCPARSWRGASCRPLGCSPRRPSCRPTRSLAMGSSDRQMPSAGWGSLLGRRRRASAHVVAVPSAADRPRDQRLDRRLHRDPRCRPRRDRGLSRAFPSRRHAQFARRLRPSSAHRPGDCDRPRAARRTGAPAEPSDRGAPRVPRPVVGGHRPKAAHRLVSRVRGRRRADALALVPGARQGGTGPGPGARPCAAPDRSRVAGSSVAAPGCARALAVVPPTARSSRASRLLGARHPNSWPLAARSRRAPDLTVVARCRLSPPGDPLPIPPGAPRLRAARDCQPAGPARRYGGAVDQGDQEAWDPKYSEKQQVAPPEGGATHGESPAATYSPRGSRPKYHRRWRA